MATQTKDHLKPTFSLSHFLTRNGFTVMELLVVVVIIGIMLGVAIPKFAGSRSRTSVKLATRSVASVMQLARSKALSEGERYLTVFNLDTGNIWVQLAGSDSQDPYDPIGKNPLFGSERKIPKEAKILEVTAGENGRGGDSGITYYQFFSKGTSQLGAVKLCEARATEATAKVKYKVSNSLYGMSVVCDYW